MTPSSRVQSHGWLQLPADKCAQAAVRSDSSSTRFCSPRAAGPSPRSRLWGAAGRHDRTNNACPVTILRSPDRRPLRHRGERPRLRGIGVERLASSRRRGHDLPGDDGFRGGPADASKADDNPAVPPHDGGRGPPAQPAPCPGRSHLRGSDGLARPSATGRLGGTGGGSSRRVTGAFHRFARTVARVPRSRRVHRGLQGSRIRPRVGLAVA